VLGISYNTVVTYDPADSDLLSACDDSEVEDELESGVAEQSGVVEQSHLPA
jgi:hypothetical protein